MEINQVTVIGAGVMGHGIAQVFAMHGYNVNLVDISDDILRNALKKIKDSLNKFLSKGLISKEDIDNILSRIKTSISIKEGVEKSDLIIEAVPEEIDIKREVFKKADNFSPKHAIIVTNTSGLPVTAMAEVTKRPDKVAGMHWFNPPQLMKLIEIIKCKYTSQDTVNVIYDISKKLGKEPIIVNTDIRGFIANRVYRAIRYEAYAMILRGESKPIEIDSAVRYKLGVPMGPLELVDFTGGLQIELSESKSIEDLRRNYPDWEPQDEYIKFRQFAMSLAEQYVREGKLGVKSGIGFYKYPGPGIWRKIDIPPEAGENIDILSIISPAINIATWMISKEVSTARSIDLALKLGFRFSKGILELADEYGIEKVVENLLAKREKYKKHIYSDVYIPNNLLIDMMRKGIKFYQ